MMSLKYGILSLLAFLFIFILAIKNYETWTHPIGVIFEENIAKRSVEKTEGPPMGGGQTEKAPIEWDAGVAEKNIFHPERKEFPSLIKPEVKKPVVRPPIILYGVTLADDFQSATIVHPGRNLKTGEREMMSLKVGDSIGEYKLAKVQPDRIMMEGAGDSFEVLLYDPKVVKKRSNIETENRPVAIVSSVSTSPTIPADLTKTSPPSVATEKAKEPATTTPIPPTGFSGRRLPRRFTSPEPSISEGQTGSSTSTGPPASSSGPPGSSSGGL